jgi:hypothetical protein
MNEWMRQHQRIVLTFALLAMVGTGFYGVMYLVKSPSGPGRGPGGAYFALDGRRISMEPEALYQERLLRWHLTRGGDYPGGAALRNLAQLQLSKDMGFEVGDQELIGVEREDIKRRTSHDQIDETLLKALLDDLQITRNQYERLLREDCTVRRVVGLFQEQARVTEGEQYLSYCQRKQRVRIFYKEFLAKDCEELVGDPSPKEIGEYYDEYSKPPKEDKAQRTAADSLDSEPTLSIDVLYFTKEFATKDVKPTDEDLKKYYQDRRNQFPRAVKPGDPVPTGDEAFKTFEEAKPEVLAKYLDFYASDKANEIKAKFEKEIAEAEQKAEASKVKFDWASFAEKHGVTYWRTEKLKQRGFEKGSDKVKALDFRLAGDAALFRLAQKGENAEAEQKLAGDRKKFSGARRILFNTPEEGFVMFRLAEYQAQALMNLEEATPVIRRRLREQRAQEKAAAVATEFQEKWLKGEAVPKASDLKEETCSIPLAAPVRNPLFSDLMRNPKPVGELLPVSSYQKDEEVLKERPDTRLGRYLVGFVAERETPSLDYYEKDTFDREGGLMAQYQVMMRGREMAWEADQFLWKYQGYEMDAGIPERPLASRAEPTAPPPDL